MDRAISVLQESIRNLQEVVNDPEVDLDVKWAAETKVIMYKDAIKELQSQLTTQDD